jgi:hypothetical protein
MSRLRRDIRRLSRHLRRGMLGRTTSPNPGGPAWVYPDLTYFNEVGSGGHFAAWEEPELFSTEVRAAFSSLR